MNKIFSFLKKSNRYKHLIGGLLVGLCPCRHEQPSILQSSQPHVSNSKTSFTAVLGTGLTGLAQYLVVSSQ